MHVLHLKKKFFFIDFFLKDLFKYNLVWGDLKYGPLVLGNRQMPVKSSSCWQFFIVVRAIT